jgi:hypothetical protein
MNTIVGENMNSIRDEAGLPTKVINRPIEIVRK